jgi:NADH-quinone oxidoreductase subunit L
MFFAAGVGGSGAAMFPLFTHAFFKALLFLCAGSVIHAMHHEQDMRFYGALRKHIPITFWTMTIGTLSITGVGIAGLFGFAGFYSKDSIIEHAYAAGTGIGGFAFAIGVFAALLTSFYSWRLVFMTFFGKARWAESEHIRHALHDHHGDHPSDEDAGHDTREGEAGIAAIHAGTGGYHPHESPWTMLVPLLVLALGALMAGYIFEPWFVSPEGAPRFWAGSIAFSEHLAHASHLIPPLAKFSASIAMLIGLAIAFYAYIRNTAFPAAFVAHFELLYRFLLNKWYFDEIYGALVVRPALALGRLFWKKGDEATINRFGPDGVAATIVAGTRVTGRFQSGYLYTYALVMLLGVAAATTWAMAR